jgi:hypothetical protein
MSYRIDGYMPPQTGAGLDGYDTLISAQSATGTNGIGGNVIITSGSGPLGDGYVRLQVGGQDMVVLDVTCSMLVSFKKLGVIVAANS